MLFEYIVQWISSLQTPFSSHHLLLISNHHFPTICMKNSPPPTTASSSAAATTTVASSYLIAVIIIILLCCAANTECIQEKSSTNAHYPLNHVANYHPFHPRPPHRPPPPQLRREIDSRYGVEQRLVPSGPNPLHNWTQLNNIMNGTSISRN